MNDLEKEDVYRKVTRLRDFLRRLEGGANAPTISLLVGVLDSFYLAFMEMKNANAFLSEWKERINYTVRLAERDLENLPAAVYAQTSGAIRTFALALKGKAHTRSVYFVTHGKTIFRYIYDHGDEI